MNSISWMVKNYLFFDSFPPFRMQDWHTRRVSSDKVCWSAERECYWMSSFMMVCERFVIFPLIVPPPQANDREEERESEGFSWKKPVYLSAGQTSPPPTQPTTEQGLFCLGLAFHSLSPSLHSSIHQDSGELSLFHSSLSFPFEARCLWEFSAFSELSDSLSVCVCVCAYVCEQKFPVSRIFWHLPTWKQSLTAVNSPPASHSKRRRSVISWLVFEW